MKFFHLTEGTDHDKQNQHNSQSCDRELRRMRSFIKEVRNTPISLTFIFLDKTLRYVIKLDIVYFVITITI